jgi:tetratricopeptide (TPR) repeat protein
VSGKKLEIILLSLLLLIAAQSVRAGSVGKVVNEGNKLYRQGQYKEAINEYDKAAIQSPEVVEPRFNKADGYFRLDDLQQAIDLYKAVAAESKDMQLVEKAKYNLGNCLFRQGSKLKDSDSQKALENMQTAIGCWRQVLDINPANEKAAKNIEVARLTIKDIIDQINKQKQQQKQTQEDLKKLLEQQKSLADKTQQTKQKADSNDISQQQARQDYKDIAKQQSDLKDKTEQAMDKMQQQNDPNNPDQKQQQAEQNLKNATDKQKDAAEKLKNSDAAGGKQSQDEAAKDIEKALKSLSDQQNQQQKQQQNSQQQKQQEPNQPQEPNQAQQQQQQEQQAAPDTTAEEILDREQKQKEQRQMLQSPGFQKVDKDW